MNIGRQVNDFKLKNTFRDSLREDTVRLVNAVPNNCLYCTVYCRMQGSVKKLFENKIRSLYNKSFDIQECPKNRIVNTLT